MCVCVCVCVCVCDSMETMEEGTASLVIEPEVFTGGGRITLFVLVCMCVYVCMRVCVCVSQCLRGPQIVVALSVSCLDACVCVCLCVCECVWNHLVKMCMCMLYRI